ncbi:MAG: outer membrane protein assembly factor BamA [candidate division Zixibacteria bacterium]|nr:outer membrane protein assembly factor BamA [candidate division Zixibacteria bacterium]MBU1469177.1 outer membrane protein assembly factor BamA [candidate division Zixibacteria bacterium]MBU2626585.1 outer membrane protein assembly factor BamA [candidate division Zixibacteria bacterium]
MNSRGTDSKPCIATAAILLAVAIAIFALPAALFAQDYSISSVDVRGNRTVDQTLIMSVSDLPVGSILTSTATQDAIRRVYSLGLFSDVKIEGDRSGDNIALHIVVKEFPRLKEVRYEGNDKVNDDDLDEALQIKIGQVATPNLLQLTVNSILDLYREKGYFLAEVKHEEEIDLEKGIAVVKFKIKENAKIKIKAIEFEGNVAFSDGDLRGKMSNKPKSFFRGGSFNKSKYPEDKEKVVEFYNEKGYIDARIMGDTLILVEDQKKLIIRIEVEEGLRYRFGNTTFSGHKLFNDEHLASKLKYDEGDVYNREKYEESVGELYSIYQEEGNIHARIFDNISTTDSTVDIAFEISEGVPAKINLVQIEGNSKTKEKVIRRELFSSPGQVFRRSLLMRSVRNVMVLNYFENVEPDFKVLENGDVDLILKVTEKPTGQFNVGAGYSGQDKFVGTLGLGIPNFRGNGQNVDIKWEFGGRRSSFSLGFTEPWLLDSPTSLGIDLYSINRRWYEDFTEGRRGLGLRLGRRLRWPDDYFGVYWRYRAEDVRYYEFSDTYKAQTIDDATSLTRFDEDWQRTSSMTVTVTRDSRDLSQFATAGSVVSLSGEYSGGLLGGDWRYNKFILQVSKFQKVFWKFVIAAKARYGLIFAPEGDSKVPYSERFSPGGTDLDGFIRGYDDGRVTPRTASGAYLRGRSMAVYNAELQFPLVAQQVYLLLLADAGNSWLEPKDLRPFDSRSLYGSYGFGFRLVVPGIGIIGFDFARGISGAQNEWKPHFQIGTTF